MPESRPIDTGAEPFTEDVVQVDAKQLPQPVKVCRKCSVQSETSGDFCPNCGTSFLVRTRRLRLSKRMVIILAAILVVLAAGSAVALSVQHANQVAAEEERAAAVAAEKKEREDAAQAEAEREEAERKAAEEADDMERAMRLLTVTSLEESVLKDAKERVDKGVLKGPILRASCTPLGGGSTDDLTAITGTFDCIAVNEEHDDGSASGYGFSATVNWDEGSYSWNLGN
ncbi:DUF2510 domain-containing protein [Arthrobacter sp. MSA 4-2]|uniref:DUF2510 domain-containing protein n=1 Tax=Arthrobacter sp. MSA 4-2 TaxID=2794349 RepID=UPI0018E70B0B|nr:DUF2510 domain-containing protein [Arthrobacter sp. MSA 4-2]MBJ2119418.1 DUF2510 domain-containing protein [Arthrobacter sp. MSA 4-2]